MHLFESAAESINLSGESRNEIEMQEKCNFSTIAAYRSCSWNTEDIYGAHVQSPAHRHIHHRSRIQLGLPGESDPYFLFEPLCSISWIQVWFMAAIPIPFFRSRFQS